MEFWLARGKYNIKLRHSTERISLGLHKLTYDIADRDNASPRHYKYFEDEKRKNHEFTSC